MSNWQLLTAQTIMNEACAPGKPGAPFQPLVCMQAAFDYGTITANDITQSLRRDSTLAAVHDMPAPVLQPSHAQVVSALASIGKFTPSSRFCTPTAQ